jgi:hypothetical protein
MCVPKTPAEPAVFAVEIVAVSVLISAVPKPDDFVTTFVDGVTVLSS